MAIKQTSNESNKRETAELRRSGNERGNAIERLGENGMQWGMSCIEQGRLRKSSFWESQACMRSNGPACTCIAFYDRSLSGRLHTHCHVSWAAHNWWICQARKSPRYVSGECMEWEWHSPARCLLLSISASLSSRRHRSVSVYAGTLSQCETWASR